MATASEVFRPNDIPVQTYVKRSGTDYEAELRRALAESGAIVSLTGPSKSGKTVLAERVIGKANWIYIPCSQVGDADSLWSEVLRQLNMPQNESLEIAKDSAFRTGAEAGGEFGVPMVLAGQATLSSETEHAKGQTRRFERPRAGASEAIWGLVKSGRTLVIDDFHYLEREVQIVVGRQLKDAAFKGVPVAILSVPHRGDDPVRAVPDLRGRMKGISLLYWDSSELAQIGRIGFPLLGMIVPEESIQKLAEESLGSPQLMQRLCLDTCHHFGVEKSLLTPKSLEISASVSAEVMRRAATSSDYTTMAKSLESGPDWGKKRDEFFLVDGTKGDVYTCVLAALALPPPQLSVGYPELKNRVSRVTRGKTPTGQAIKRAIAFLEKRAIELSEKAVPPQEPVVQWEEERGGVLDSPDPYFVFYLRWVRFPHLNSPKQASLREVY